MLLGKLFCLMVSKITTSMGIESNELIFRAHWGRSASLMLLIIGVVSNGFSFIIWISKHTQWNKWTLECYRLCWGHITSDFQFGNWKKIYIANTVCNTIVIEFVFSLQFRIQCDSRLLNMEYIVLQDNSLIYHPYAALFYCQYFLFFFFNLNVERANFFSLFCAIFLLFISKCNLWLFIKMFFFLFSSASIFHISVQLLPWIYLMMLI